MYVMAPAIDSINITSVQLQARSLMIAQQENLVQNLLGTIMSMFKIEFGAVDDGEACEENGHDRYVHQGSLRISTEAIIDHIENQGSFARDCHESLEAAD
ncbi:unnamed protein product [Sphagnum jensenii]|uniref:Uncharacterized protein n=1 Tax=Sphagnum jensenii TaxID=128206 RepID=A0ABP1BCC0_9BRYO